MAQKLRDEYGGLRSAVFLACVPSQPPDEFIPHYKIILIGAAVQEGDQRAELAHRCDALLAEANCEYRSKRQSGRLACVRSLQMPLDEFAARMGSAPPRSWGEPV